MPNTTVKSTANAQGLMVNAGYWKRMYRNQRERLEGYYANPPAILSDAQHHQLVLDLIGHGMRLRVPHGGGAGSLVEGFAERGRAAQLVHADIIKGVVPKLKYYGTDGGADFYCHIQ